jgi:type I restriction enzyme S subunit
MSDWRSTTIGDVLTLQRGIDITRAEQRPGPVPVVSSGGISSYHDTAAITAPGVVIGRKGTLGTTFYLDCDYWPHDTTLWVKDFKGSLPRFVYYFFVNLDVKGLDVGSANPTLNRNHVHPLRVRWPDRPEQERIAAALGALDDKITVNVSVASTSLALAQTQYDESAMSDSWRSLPMGQSANWMSGGTPSTTEPSYWDGDIPWISALSLKSPWIADSDRKVTQLGVEHGTRVVPRNTILFVVRGSSLDSEFRIGLTQRDVAFGQDCKALLAADGIDPVVLFLAIRSRSAAILNLVDHAGHGAGRLATDLISNVLVRLPDPSLQAVTCNRLTHLVALGARCRSENRTLTELRDTLLPKLMSGEIRVRDAERIVEDVT